MYIHTEVPSTHTNIFVVVFCEFYYTRRTIYERWVIVLHSRRLPLYSNILNAARANNHINKNNTKVDTILVKPVKNKKTTKPCAVMTLRMRFASIKLITVKANFKGNFHCVFALCVSPLIFEQQKQRKKPIQNLCFKISRT